MAAEKRKLVERLWDAEWLFLAVGLLFGAALGYLVGRAGYLQLPVGNLEGQFWALFKGGLSVIFWWTAAWIAFKPRKTFEGVKDWSKLGAFQIIVLKASDNYLALSAVLIAIGMAGSLVGADIIRAFLPFGSSSGDTP